MTDESRTCLFCNGAIRGEFVLQIATRHVRWFCSMLCAVDSYESHIRAIEDSPDPPDFS